jgi:nitrogen-specific signal transduction histidine kinase
MEQSVAVTRMTEFQQPMLQVSVAGVALRSEERSVDVRMMQASGDTISRPLVLLDSHFRIRSANRAFCDHFGLSSSISNGTLLFTVCNNQWSNPAVRALLLETLESYEPIERSVSLDVPEVGSCLLKLKAQRRQRNGTAVELIHLSVEECLILTLPTDSEDETTALVEEKTLAQTVTSMSRDLNRALAVIIGSAQILSQHEDPAVRDDAQNIASSVSRVQAILSAFVSQAREVESLETADVRGDQSDVTHVPHFAHGDLSLHRNAARSTPYPFLKVA